MDAPQGKAAFVPGSVSGGTGQGWEVFKKKKFVIGIAIIVVAIGWLGVTAFQNAASYYYRIPDLLAMGEEIYDTSLRVSGTVLAGSIERSGLDVAFTVVEEGESLEVNYTGIVPDTFKDDADVVVEGRLAPDGVFTANTILMKCPSKYEAEEPSE